MTELDFSKKLAQQANGLQNFDSVSAIATLSLAIVDLQKMVGSMQGSVQQLGMHLGQMMQAHNAMAEKVESLLGKSECREKIPGKESA